MPEIITTGEVAFGEPEPVTVADLRQGDFVVAFASQGGIRGYRVNSGIREISDPATGRWSRRSRPRGPAMPVPSRSIRFLDPEVTALNLPCDHVVITRRRLSA